jgi:hypothetical protein
VETATCEANLAPNQSGSTYQNLKRRIQCVQTDISDRRIDINMVLRSADSITKGLYALFVLMSLSKSQNVQL